MPPESTCHACGQTVEDPKGNFRVPYVHAIVDSEIVEIFLCDEKGCHTSKSEPLQLEKLEVLQFIEWLQNALEFMDDEEVEDV